ncbi:MAG: VCBS repeat-containing protein [Blastocatellia bacterium]
MIIIAITSVPLIWACEAESLPVEVIRTQGAPATTVSAEFQQEVSQLAAGGLRLKEALEASLDGTARHLAGVFQRVQPKAPNEAFELRILESDGRLAKTIFRRADFFFSFASAGEPNKLNGTDINGDGIKEIIVQSSSGGNCWSCNPTEIYQVRNHKAELIAAGPIQKIADLNGDGVGELVVMDARWESYDDLSHAASPEAAMVYAWRNGKYVYSARDFGAFYESELRRLHAAIEEAKSQITAEEYSDELYVGRAIALAMTYVHMGELDRGLKEMETLLNSNSKSAAQTKHRVVIIDDFRKGESSKKLREMNYGDPMR